MITLLQRGRFQAKRGFKRAGFFLKRAWVTLELTMCWYQLGERPNESHNREQEDYCEWWSAHKLFGSRISKEVCFPSQFALCYVE